MSNTTPAIDFRGWNDSLWSGYASSELAQLTGDSNWAPFAQMALNYGMGELLKWKTNRLLQKQALQNRGNLGNTGTTGVNGSPGAEALAKANSTMTAVNAFSDTNDIGTRMLAKYELTHPLEMALQLYGPLWEPAQGSTVPDISTNTATTTNTQPSTQFEGSPYKIPDWLEIGALSELQPWKTGNPTIDNNIASQNNVSTTTPTVDLNTLPAASGSAPLLTNTNTTTVNTGTTNVTTPTAPTVNATATAPTANTGAAATGTTATGGGAAGGGTAGTGGTGGTGADAGAGGAGGTGGSKVSAKLKSMFSTDSMVSSGAGMAGGMLGSYGGQALGSAMFGNSKGGLFASGIMGLVGGLVAGSVASTVASNLANGSSAFSGVGSNLGSSIAGNAGSLAGAGAGVANIALDVFDPVKKAKWENAVNMGLGVAALATPWTAVAALAFNAIGHGFGSKTLNYTADRDLLASTGNSYKDFTNTSLEAESLAGLKHSLWDNAGRKDDNNKINEAKRQEMIVRDIMGYSNLRHDIADGTTSINNLRVGNDMMGGYDQRYALRVKNGAKLDILRARRILTKFQTGGPIQKEYDYDGARQYVYERFPILKNNNILFELQYDDAFQPNRDLNTDEFGNIEYMGADYDDLGYYNGYKKLDKFLGKSTIVFNSKATPEDIALDAVSHGLRELDPQWQAYLEELEEDPTFRSIVEDELLLRDYPNPADFRKLSSLEKMRYFSNFRNSQNYRNGIDGLVRALIVKPEERIARGYGYPEESFEALSKSPVWQKMLSYLQGKPVEVHKTGGIIKLIDPTSFDPEEFKDGGVITLIDPTSFDPEVEEFKEGGSLYKKSTITLLSPEDITDEDEDDIEIFLQGGTLYKVPKAVLDFYGNPSLENVNFYEDPQARTEGNDIYVNSDESAVHELYHYLSNNLPDEAYEPWYSDLNDEKIRLFGGDMEFVSRTGNPGDFYQPSELVARLMAAKYRTQGVQYTPEFFRMLRSRENLYGDNMRDLLHMFNDENLVKIFNTSSAKKFLNGGSINIIPEGALHAHKHHMEDADHLTKKGIPVVDNDDVQQAEIEREEIIFRKSVTETLEKLLKLYDSEESSLSEKDLAALEAGQLLVKEILHNTIDNTNNLL